MVRPGPGVYIINVKHKETLCFFCVKRNVSNRQIKSNQISNQISENDLPSNHFDIYQFDAQV